MFSFTVRNSVQHVKLLLLFLLCPTNTSKLPIFSDKPHFLSSASRPQSFPPAAKHTRRSRDWKAEFWVHCSGKRGVSTLEKELKAILKEQSVKQKRRIQNDRLQSKTTTTTKNNQNVLMEQIQRVKAQKTFKDTIIQKEKSSVSVATFSVTVSGCRQTRQSVRAAVGLVVSPRINEAQLFFFFLCSVFCTQRNSGRDETHEQQSDDNSPNNRTSSKICFLSSRCWWTSVTVLLLSANKRRGSGRRSAPNLRDERPRDEPLGRPTSGGETHGNVQVWKCRLLFFFSLLQSCALRFGKTGIQLVFDVFCCVHSLLLSIQKATIYGFLLMLEKHKYRKNIQRKVIKRSVHRLRGTSCWWSTTKTPKYNKAPYFCLVVFFFCLKTLRICETI